MPSKTNVKMALSKITEVLDVPTQAEYVEQKDLLEDEEWQN